MTERWLLKLRERLDAIEPPAKLRLPGGPPQTPREPTPWARISAAVIGLLITAGILIGGWLVLQSSRERSPGGGEEERTPPAAVVDVVCGDETILRTSSVVRQPDGVHFRLSNPGRAGALFVRDRENNQESWMRGALADQPSSEFVLPVPPGEVLVACLHPPVDTLRLRPEEFAPLRVLPTEEVSGG